MQLPLEVLEARRARKRELRRKLVRPERMENLVDAQGNFNPPEKYVQRFWTKIKKTDTCWIWSAGKFPQGYGAFGFMRRTVKAHRFSFLLHGGKFTDNAKDVNHSCHNTACVNPAHLHAGNDKSNMREKFEAGRSNVLGDDNYARKHPEEHQGENNGRAVLTEDDVKRIRSTYASGCFSQTQLADKFGVTQTTISSIVRRRLWPLVK